VRRPGNSREDRNRNCRRRSRFLLGRDRSGMGPGATRNGQQQHDGGPMSQTAHGPSLPALVCLRKISGCDHGNPSQWRDWHRCKNRAPNRDRGLSRQRRQVPPRRSSPPGEIGERSPEAMTVGFGPCLTRYVLGVVGNSGSTDDWVTSRFAQRTSHDQEPRGAKSDTGGQLELPPTQTRAPRTRRDRPKYARSTPTPTPALPAS
jgi:hypothetical protein